MPLASAESVSSAARRADVPQDGVAVVARGDERATVRSEARRQSLGRRDGRRARADDPVVQIDEADGAVGLADCDRAIVRADGEGARGPGRGRRADARSARKGRRVRPSRNLSAVRAVTVEHKRPLPVASGGREGGVTEPERSDDAAPATRVEALHGSSAVAASGPSRHARDVDAVCAGEVQAGDLPLGSRRAPAAAPASCACACPSATPGSPSWGQWGDHKPAAVGAVGELGDPPVARLARRGPRRAVASAYRTGTGCRRGRPRRASVPRGSARAPRSARRTPCA